MNNTLELPGGIAFADAESEANYQLALEQKPNQFGIVPLIVITGPMASGKTRLADHLIRSIHPGIDPVFFSASRRGEEIERRINASLDQKYIWFDECRTMRSRAIASLVHKPKVSYRPLYKTQFITKQSQIETIVLTGNEIRLSDDFERRSLIIRLAPRIATDA